MFYKDKASYDAGLATAEMFGAGWAFKQRNAYKGQPLEERIGYGHKVGRNQGPARKPVEELTEDLKGAITTTTSPAVLAMIIRDHWKPVCVGAVPYLQAMARMSTFDKDYGADDGRGIGLYFLSNATTWKGEVARAVKARVKELCK